MTYSGAAQAAEGRALLGQALEALQKDPKVPKDVLAVTENLAGAVGALFEAEKATSDLDGKASVKHAMGSLSQTMALLQDVKSQHEGIQVATRALAQVMSRLYPLATVPTLRPSAAPSPAAQIATAATAPAQQAANPPPKAAVPAHAQTAQTAQTAQPATAPAKPATANPAKPATAPHTGPREKLEANVGATTESNFFVGFSGDIAEGGVFIATYATFAVGAPVEVLVTLPGGYSSTIPGSVRFVRDPMDMDSEPGVGVRFDTLTQEQRDLILRFIRKRAPVFYDD
jgi:uncharacterized protein (TIGR02266 family)